MKICIFGAGAIGGFLGAELARAGVDVSLIARGAHLDAMRRHGLTLERDGARHTVHPACTHDAAEVGPQDYVVVALKAHSVPGVVDAMQPLLGPHTALVTAANGIPWWYFHEFDGPLQGHRLDSVDPGGRLWDGIGPERAIGCILYPATEIAAPGVIRHVSGDRFTLGEPDGSRSERVMALSRLLVSAGLRAPVRRRIRDEIWMKLWGNVSFNPISILTGAMLDAICTNPDSRAVVHAMMVEARAVGEALGARFPLDVEARIEGSAAVGAHKTSMLQDLERGRALEIEPVVGAVAEMGRLVDVGTPTVDTVLALVRARARAAGVSPD
jgi:2-dehydropantoate 2-reductase